jgi:pilus assembly protein CpaB
MRPARFIVLAVAVVAAGLAGVLALNLTSRQPVVITQTAEPVIERVEVDDVLVAASSLPIGSRLSEDALAWQEWPKNAVVDGFITRSTRPEAVSEMSGAVVRLPIFEGEPLRSEKIVDSSTRIMSSILPAGKRAVATEISVATGAGGFILPNDRVDVIMVRRGDQDQYLTEVVLSNIRVLAIDQRIQEDPDGNKTAVGSTATLELTPEQAQIISVVQQMADRLTLALRSVADVQESDIDGADYLLSGDSSSNTIQLIRSGAITNIGN